MRHPFGIKMVTDGVMVVGTGSVTNLQSQAVNPAEDAGVLEGDVILSLNGEKISSKKQLTQIVSACSGQPISMVIRRGDELEQLTVSPVKSSLDNDYHLGLWVRDSSAGIGTMTFYDPQNGCFAGLGPCHLRRGHRPDHAAFSGRNCGGLHHRGRSRFLRRSRPATGGFCGAEGVGSIVCQQLQRRIRTAV